MAKAVVRDMVHSEIESPVRKSSVRNVDNKLRGSESVDTGRVAEVALLTAVLTTTLRQRVRGL